MTKATKKAKPAVASKDLRTFFTPKVLVQLTADHDAENLPRASGNCVSGNVGALHVGSSAEGAHRICRSLASGGSPSSNSSTCTHRALVLPIKAPLGLDGVAAPQPGSQKRRKRVQHVRSSKKSAAIPRVNGAATVVATELLPTTCDSMPFAQVESQVPPRSLIEAPVVRIRAQRQPLKQVLRCTERFTTSYCTPCGQYCDTYTARLNALRGRVLLQAHAQWSGQLPSISFLNSVQEAKLPAIGSPDSVIVGILFKEFASRQSLTDAYSGSGAPDGCGSVAGEKGANLCSDSDVLWLEDASQRLRLSLAPFLVAHFVTGLVAAVRGRLCQNGIFQVTDVALSMLPMPQKIPVSICTGISDQGPFVAFMSGLNFGALERNSQALRHAAAFLLGQSDREHDKQLSSTIQWLIVAGGTFAEGGAMVGLDDADSFFAELAAVVSVDLMPGGHDPTNLSLPQMPLSPHLFKRARQCQDFHAVTNPYECSLDGLHMLGHSGQPAEDLLRCTRAASPLAALEMSLKAMHLAPTVPDTLAAMPSAGPDPFVIEQVPHLLFSGGHDAAAYSWHGARCGSTGTLCLCVPAFHRQPAIVLVNMRDPRDVRMLRFDDLGPVRI